MTKVISYSLSGNEARYVVGARENAERAAEFFPDWQMVVYYDPDTVSGQNVSDLSKYVNVRMIPADTSWANVYFWRYLAFDDPAFDVVIVRDLDDRLCKRDKAAVDEWLASDKDMHIIRDHVWHRMMIMGGLFGARNHLLRGMKERIDAFLRVLGRPPRYFDDECFLTGTIYPIFYEHAFIHALEPFMHFETVHKIQDDSEKSLGIIYEV